VQPLALTQLPFFGWRRRNKISGPRNRGRWIESVDAVDRPWRRDWRDTADSVWGWPPSRHPLGSRW